LQREPSLLSTLESLHNLCRHDRGNIGALQLVLKRLHHLFRHGRGNIGALHLVLKRLHHLFRHGRGNSPFPRDLLYRCLREGL